MWARLTNGTSQDFSDQPAGREMLLAEVATRETSGDSFLTGLGLLPDPDPVLRKRGDDATVLRDLSADDAVCTAIQSRKIKTLNKRNFRFSPGALDGQEPNESAVALCRALEKDLERVDLLALFSEILDAPYYGYTVIELLWRANAGAMRLADIVAKPRHWFGWNDLNQFCFLEAGVSEKPVPPHKFVVARHFPSYENPYGLRLLSRCLWPVAFKSGGVRFWMIFAERFGIPWVIGHYTGGDETKRQQMLSQLSTMVQDAVAVISGGGNVDIHDVSGKAGALHQDMVKHWDSAVSRVIMGQTLTSSDGGGAGSYALGQTHYAVLEDYAECDETLLATAMNDLAWSYGQVNAPGELSPVFEFIQPEDHMSRAELDGKLKESGVRFRKAHYTRAYGLAEDEFDVEGDDAGQPAFSSDFAEAEDNAQRILDDMVTKALPKAVGISESMVNEILTLVDKAESYEDLQILLGEALSGLASDKELEQAMQEILIAAELYGRYSVEGGGDES